MHVSREVTLDATAEEVWRLVTDSEALSSWFGGDVVLDPRLGGAGTFVDGPVVRHAVVDDLDEGRRIGFVWQTEEGDASRVELTLVESDAGTVLRVTETALAGARLCSIADAGGLWDDRLFGLEVRCVTAAFEPVPVRVW
jgi:uncharacterized protein YndB with AHSA1/START domain